MFSEVAVAQLTHMHLRCCGPGFESQAHNQCFSIYSQFLNYIWHWVDKRMKRTQKRPVFGPYLNSANVIFPSKNMRHNSWLRKILPIFFFQFIRIQDFWRFLQKSFFTFTTVPSNIKLLSWMMIHPWSKPWN